MVDEIVAAKPKSTILKTRKQINAYLRRYFKNVPHDDMQGRVPKIMGTAALGHLNFGKIRKPGQAKLRIYNPNKAEHGFQSRFTIV